MNNVFLKEIEEIYNERIKKKEIANIKEALLAGSLREADILFKYSTLTSKEYEAIKMGFTKKKRS